MENRYRIILTGNHLYKEAEITPEMTSIRLGTATECEIRLLKDAFFEQIELTFVKSGDVWRVICADNLYLNVGDARKLYTLTLCHGCLFHVHYQSANSEVFAVEFLIDFENERKKLTRQIDVRGVSSFGIGTGSDNAIRLISPYLRDDSLALSSDPNGLLLYIRNTTYGVYLNGRRAQNGELIHSGDFFSISDMIFYYRNGCLWTENSNRILISGLRFADWGTDSDYPKFKRNSRVKVVPSEDSIEILDPPNKPEKPKERLLQRLLPSMGMFVAAGAMVAINNNPTMLVFSGVSGAMAIVTAIIGMREGKKEFQQKTQERLDKYQTYISNKRAEIEQARQDERTVLEEIYVSNEVEQQNLAGFTCDLFDRSADDEDFLCVRLGTGDIAAKRTLDYKKQERLEIEDDLQLMPAQLEEDYHNINNAPVVCDFKAMNAIGLIGARECQLAMMKNMVLDIVARQYHSDVRLVFVADDDHKDQVWRYRMLPHV